MEGMYGIPLEKYANHIHINMYIPQHYASHSQLEPHAVMYLVIFERDMILVNGIPAIG